MRILHVITSLRMGGAERLVCDMLPRLENRGHDVVLLLFDGSQTPLYKELAARGIKINALGKGAFQMWNPFHLFRLKKWLKRECFDIVHTHNTPCQLLMAMAATSKAPILVTTEHNTFNRRRNWRWYDIIDRWMYGKYSHIICVGEQTRANLVSKIGVGADNAKISVVPNGIDLHRFSEAVPEPTLRRPEETNKRIIVMVAAFRPQKDQPTLIKAMVHLTDDYRLWLVGDGIMRPSCEKLAEELNLSERVRFWGVREDVAKLLAAADVVVLSSQYEGMSLSSIEGMAAGKPFVASDVEGLREVVGGAGVLFPYGDDGTLAAHIRELCENKAFWNETASRCHERAMQYDIERVADGYEHIYRELYNKN